MLDVQVPRVRAPSLDAFRRDWQLPAEPVVLTHAIEAWPALHRWSPDSLRRELGDRRFPVIRATNGMTEYSPRRGVRYAAQHLSTFADAVAAGEQPGYLVLKTDELPALLDDVQDLPYCAGAEWTKSQFYFAPSGLGGALHRDLPDNLHAQIHGRKRWYLFDRRETRNLYSHHPWSGAPNYSRADVEKPDFRKFPRLRGLRRWSAVVEPGELLYVPRRWWHQVRSLDVTLSINFWWARGMTLALIRAAETFGKLRGLRL